MFYNHSVIGRLKDGVTIEQATRDTAALASRITENYPPQLRNSGMTLQIAATPLLEEISGQVRRPLLILLGAVGLVLVRGLRERGEPVPQPRRGAAARDGRARGAWRRRATACSRCCWLESLLLALVGGAVGLLIAQLDAARGACRSDGQPAGRVRRLARHPRRVVHHGPLDRDGAVLRPRADDRRHEARADRRAPRRRALGRRPAPASPAGRAWWSPASRSRSCCSSRPAC